MCRILWTHEYSVVDGKRRKDVHVPARVKKRSAFFSQVEADQARLGEKKRMGLGKTQRIGEEDRVKRSKQREDFSRRSLYRAKGVVLIKVILKCETRHCQIMGMFRAHPR